MPKHDDRHLTTTQLSALIDNQLPAQELATCRAHLQTCRQCQTALAGLQQTVSLLQALPEPALPRSFALPAGVAYLQEQPARQEDAEQQQAINAPPPRRQAWQYYARRSLRAASAIAAVIGLFFLLSGLLPMLPHGGGGASTSTGSTTQLQKNPSTFGPAVANTNRTATAAAQRAINGLPPATTTRPEAGKTPAVPTSSGGVHNQDHSAASQPHPSLPLPDLSTPLGQQEVGFTLFVLGIVGILLTRRKQKARQTP